MTAQSSTLITRVSRIFLRKRLGKLNEVEAHDDEIPMDPFSSNAKFRIVVTDNHYYLGLTRCKASSYGQRASGSCE
jgi:hypothetical protein